MMEAIILAGGFGTRLKSVIADIPKPMAPIAGRPFLEFLLIMLARKGFRRVVLSLGYMADIIFNHFGDHCDGLKLVYEIEEAPLGTGGAIRKAIEQCESDHVFVFNGDTYLDLEVQDVEHLWLMSHRPIIVGREVQDASRYGRLIADNGRVTGFAEKGMGGPAYINAGCYVLPAEILNSYTPGEPFSLEKDFFPKAVIEQRFDLFITQGHFIDIGVPEDYARAQMELADLY